MSSTIAIMGCGWLGLPLAEALLKNGWTIHGSTTSEDKIQSLLNAGITPFLLQLSPDHIKGNIGQFLQGSEVLVINVPPRLRAEDSESYFDKMKVLHSEIKKSGVRKIIFVSSTSVYGDQSGVLDEKSKARPNTESGRHLLASEQLFIQDPGLHTTVVRFGGLIGGDRHPVSHLSGKTELRNGEHPVNLIHRTDAISLVQIIIEKEYWNAIVNGVAPEHPEKQDYYRSEALKRGLTPPDYQQSTGANPGKLVECKYFPYKRSVFLTSIFS
ncbi:SDR family oxidoreductase [Zeaxanthinibacter sp. PT1]|uniref:SDR family oxidoreductase n=1 Tax=Zeaxanthinibacter TaxID=561554 RepID=UPI00234BB94E|nr:SDR family oxidoreductase [Zeaxanthinibacter sp. PT1]MDC6350347.1 SDR family oxidoreductase [Zeaxanthinibacter sp. PT1]